MSAQLDPGDIKKLSVAVTDDAGVAADPTTLSLEVKRPDGTLDTFAIGSGITRLAAGSYFSLYELPAKGAYEYRWRSTGIQFNERGTLYCGVDTITESPFPEEGFTVAEVWARSPMLKSKYPQGSGDGDLVLSVVAVVPLVASITGRNIGGKTDGEEVPAALEELMLRGLALKTEQFISATGSAKARKTSLTRGNLSSFSAGSYSESYFGPGQMLAAKKLDSDPVLAEVLWALCTQQAKEEWLALWDPENYPQGEMSVFGFEYGNRPNYTPRAWPRGFGW